MRLRRCFAADSSPRSQAGPRWPAGSRRRTRAYIRSGMARKQRLDEPDLSGLCGRRPGLRLVGRLVADIPDDLSERLATSYGAPGHRNVIRASAPYGYRPRLCLACARRSGWTATCGWKVRRRRSTASRAAQSSGAVCRASYQEGHVIKQERRSSGFVTNCSEYD
jgi:hypothetical protein